MHRSKSPELSTMFDHVFDAADCRQTLAGIWANPQRGPHERHRRYIMKLCAGSSMPRQDENDRCHGEEWALWRRGYG
jgi:hypothetical protein